MSIQVRSGGLLSTIQDLGRTGHQAEGMVVSGAMDPFAMQIANLLVGNPPDVPTIEITMLGPILEAQTDQVVAITGADLGAEIEGIPIPLWQTVPWSKGQVLQFTGRQSAGARAYLAVAGGFRLQPFLSSCSTYLMAHIGGLHGHPLEAGDELPTRPTSNPVLRRRLATEWIPTYSSTKRLRILPGIHQEAFTSEGLQTLLTQPYTVSQRINRMGMRLIGEPIQHQTKADVLSTAVTFGTIQVPANGQPIILMADRQTTGGYTQIANVITVDRPLLGQCLPGDTLVFEIVSIQEAWQCLQEQSKLIQQLRVHQT